MRVRLGYACISKTLEHVTSSTNYTYTKFKEEEDYEKLDKIIKSNLEDLEKIIDYNIANNIHFYRMSPKLIPLATHKEVDFEYVKKYKEEFERIGKKISSSKMRVDIHPDQFCVLNSVNKEVIENSVRILEYCVNLLDALKIEDKVIVLHIGGNTFGKDKSIARFVSQYKKLELRIRECIAIENDDKIFNIEDCIKLSKRIGVPIVLDCHHHTCNSGGINLSDYLEEVFQSWNERMPKVHFSSPKNHTKKDFRSHHDYIDEKEFIKFIEICKKSNKDFDIMIEAKAKDEALFRLVRQLKYKTDYNFLDETTFEA